MTWDDAGNAANVVMGLGALAGGVFVVWRVVMPYLRLLSSLQTKLAFIEEQLRPNGGSSLRDRVNAIDTKLNQKDARQWALVSSMREPVWESSPEGLCLRVNPAMLALTQRSADEYLGNNWETTVHPEDRERCAAEWETAVIRRRSFDMTFRVVQRGGAVFRVEALSAPYIDLNTQKIAGWIGRYVHVERLDEVLLSPSHNPGETFSVSHVDQRLDTMTQQMSELARIVSTLAANRRVQLSD